MSAASNRFLVRSVRIIDTASPFGGQVKDLWIEDGIIRQVGDQLPLQPHTVLIEQPGLYVSAGWIDLRAANNDPGYEHRESARSLQEAAIRGGFVQLVLLPNSQPVVDSKDTLNYVKQLGAQGPVTFLPTAAVTKKAQGVDFTEMIDLHRAGAIAFTDGVHPIQNADILLKALLYLRPLNALLINRVEDEQLTRFGQMHEGPTSTLLGLKGMPALAEELMLLRDLKLLRYALEESALPLPAGPLLHFSGLSSAQAVQLVREAKAEGLPISCDVAAHQLAFFDTDLHRFDTNLKVNPPFRSEEDVLALRAGLADGTIDLVVSDHQPYDEESKLVEFDQAAFGISSLETTFACARMHADLPLERLIAAFTSAPRRILRLPAHSITEGAPASLTFFLPDASWTLTRLASASKNSPFLNQNLQGQVAGTLHNGHFRWLL